MRGNKAYIGVWRLDYGYISVLIHGLVANGVLH